MARKKGRKRRKKKLQRFHYKSKIYNLLDIPLIPVTLNLETRRRYIDRDIDMSKPAGRRGFFKRVDPTSRFILTDPKVSGVTVKLPAGKVRRELRMISDVQSADMRRLKICRKRYARRVALFALRKVGLGLAGGGGAKKREYTKDSKVRC